MTYAVFGLPSFWTQYGLSDCSNLNLRVGKRRLLQRPAPVEASMDPTREALIAIGMIYSP